MKLNPLVSYLSLYDIANTPGIAADVSHINSRAQVWFISLSFSMYFIDFSIKRISFYVDIFDV